MALLSLEGVSGLSGRAWVQPWQTARAMRTRPREERAGPAQGLHLPGDVG